MRRPAIRTPGLAAAMLAPALIAGVTGVALLPATPAGAFTAMGPDLDAIRANERRIAASRTRTPPRDTDGKTGGKTDGKTDGKVSTAPPAPKNPRAEMLRVLTDKEVREHRAILAAIRAGNFAQADTAIAGLKNRTLRGFLLAQRYLADGAKPSYTDLRDWLALYPDHGDAAEIHKRARLLRPDKTSDPPEPTPPGDLARLTTPSRAVILPRPAQSRRQRRRAVVLERQFGRYMTRNRLTHAARLLNQRGAERLFGAGRLDAMRTQLATRYLQLDAAAKAWPLIQPAADRTGDRLAQAHWIAGLTAWKLGKNGRAALHFSHVAKRESESDWLRAAGAYWSARAFGRLKKTAEEQTWLKAAAAFPRTFYGILARRRLGLAQRFDWQKPPLDPAQIAAIKSSPAGGRALALIQLGEQEAGAAQLLRQYIAGKEAMTATYTAIAEHGRLTTLAFLLAVRHYLRNEKLVDAALYPIPDWKPRDGFKLDRALIYAVMRQESAFRVRARSHAGARGLMQLMPATAAFIAGDRSLRRRHVERLYDPATNLHLGQKFLMHLLGRPAIQGNLFFAVAAYNAGEGNLAKWAVRDDPLLFIEAIHLHETRGYVERVLFNLWAYRFRLGQDAPTLAALAEDRWPKYKALDKIGKRPAAAAKPADKPDFPWAAFP